MRKISSVGLIFLSIVVVPLSRPVLAQTCPTEDPTVLVHTPA
jgi:hypothetical protein